jgi:hypothetical protein
LTGFVVARRSSGLVPWRRGADGRAENECHCKNETCHDEDAKGRGKGEGGRGKEIRERTARI